MRQSAQFACYICDSCGSRSQGAQYGDAAADVARTQGWALNVDGMDFCPVHRSNTP